MEYNNITQKEQGILRIMVESGQITTDDLPCGIWIGLDSMGPARSSKTDALFEEIPDVLRQFTETMQDYVLGLAVATNGPPVEGRDILLALDWSHNPRAFAAAEGGGLIISYSNGSLDEKVLAPQQEIDDLKRVEEYVKKDELMRAMLEDTIPDENGSPIRTPYETNIVLTIPENYAILRYRLNRKGVKIMDYVDWRDKGHVAKILEYARNKFAEAVKKLDLSDSIGPEIVKNPNRRVYEPVQHIIDGHEQVQLTKYNGVVVGSKALGSEFDISDSVYIADNAVDETKEEGSKVLGGSERSMIKNGGKQVRMSFNVTMNNYDLPRMDNIEGVKILHIGSGAKALEVIDFLYNQLYRPQLAQSFRAA